jgi:hypothetical protein
MEPYDPESLNGFEAKLPRVSEGDAVEVAQRQGLCAAGVRTLYVAVDDSDVPIYAQLRVRQASRRRYTARQTGSSRNSVREKRSSRVPTPS